MHQFRRPYASCAGGRFGLESEWRANAWKYWFQPSSIDMVARIRSGFWVNRWVAKQPNPTSAAWVFLVSPVTFPTFVSFVPRNAPNFPYGYDVDPD